MEGRRGFTLIELVVVMTLIAVLTVLSGGFLRDLYNNYKVAQAAEEVLGLIRDAQSKAMSVESGYKAFGLEIQAKGSGEALAQPIRQLQYTESGATLQETTTPLNLDVTSITLNRTDIENCGAIPSRCNVTAAVNSGIFNTSVSTVTNHAKSFVFNFASPFGVPEYFLRDSSVAGDSPSPNTSNYCENPIGVSSSQYDSLSISTTRCGWLQNENYLKSYSLFHVGQYPTDTAIAGRISGNVSNAFYTQNGGKARITVRYNNVTRDIVVKGTGEAYIE